MSEPAERPDPADPSDSIRASDADREATVQRLQAAFAEGRLDLAELDERTKDVYAARTLGELKKFTVDLPQSGSAAPAPRPSTGPTARPEQPTQPHKLPWLRYGLPPVVAINVVIWAVVSVSSHHVVYFWPAWILAAWVLGMFGGHRHHHRQHDRRQLDRHREDWYGRYHRESRDRYDRRDPDDS